MRARSMMMSAKRCSAGCGRTSVADVLKQAPGQMSQQRRRRLTDGAERGGPDGRTRVAHESFVFPGCLIF